jgi:hypothetical protein
MAHGCVGFKALGGRYWRKEEAASSAGGLVPAEKT